MTRRAKLLEKIRNNPKNVSFEDLDKLVRWAGFSLRPQKSGTSHFVYTKPGCPSPLTIPKKSLVNQAYVKLALKFIEEYGDIEE
jgi:hypothetical protein